MLNLGVIGCGNMASAIVSGIINSSLINKNQVHVYDINHDASNKFFAQYGVNAYADVASMLENCQIVLLAIKPQVVPFMLSSIEPKLKDKAIISIAAGISIKTLKNLLPNCRILRTMPNTPAMVQSGATMLCNETDFKDEERQFAISLFSAVGIVEWLPEHLLNAVIGVSGSSPAYVYMFIEALADAGVELGLPRHVAYRLAAQTVKGSGAMVLETNNHPGALKDMVCSPGGTTIAAVHALENSNFRGAIMSAACAAANKATEMDKT